MKKTLYLMAFLALMACGQKKPAMTPIEYNDAIIGEQTNISRLMIEMANSFSSDLSASETYRIKLANQCKESVDKIKKLPDYKGNTRFREAGVALFSFYKDISENEYKEMIAILRKEQIDQSDIDRLTQIEQQIGLREEPLDGEFQGAQQAFAKEHNLSLYENEIQKEIDDLGK
jgi:hypothetical protein